MIIEGKAALITGAANGIGLATARALQSAGARPFLVDIDGESLEVAARELGGVEHMVMDVTRRDDWARVKARTGIVDILVNNAGIGPDGRGLADMDPVSFDRLIAINLTGVFNGISTFAAGMRDRGSGHVVNIASMAALTAPPTIGAYTAAKCAVTGLSEVLRAELAGHGVGVSVIFPGLVTTRLRETTRRAGSLTPEKNVSISREAIDPAILGEIVVEAIRSGQPMAASHPEYRDAVKRKLDMVLAAFD